MVNYIKGKIFNFSLNNKGILKGWYLVITDNGTEYLVRRNYSMSCKNSYPIYKTDYSMHSYIMTYKSNTGFYLGSALFISAVLRGLIPLDLWFGENNIHINWINGGRNILILIISVFVSFKLTSWYRKMRLKSFLKTKKARLEFVGTIRSLEPLFITKQGGEFW